MSKSHLAALGGSRRQHTLLLVICRKEILPTLGCERIALEAGTNLSWLPVNSKNYSPVTRDGQTYPEPYVT